MGEIQPTVSSGSDVPWLRTIYDTKIVRMDENSIKKVKLKQAPGIRGAWYFSHDLSGVGKRRKSEGTGWIALFVIPSKVTYFPETSHNHGNCLPKDASYFERYQIAHFNLWIVQSGTVKSTDPIIPCNIFEIQPETGIRSRTTTGWIIVFFFCAKVSVRKKTNAAGQRNNKVFISPIITKAD